ncbi:MAG TPA: ABC transporter substrate-binding protein [Limnobacter sp.]|nr:ABC transporter substrate-binding protein [Limnobacter sp.]
MNMSPFSRFKNLVCPVLVMWASCLVLPASAAEPRLAVSKTPLSLPFFVARDKGLFEKYKLKPVWVECMGGNRCMKEMLEGRVDMATSSELPFMFAAFDGRPVSLVTTFVNNKDDMKFVVQKSVVQKGIKNLIGKRIGFVERSSSHYYMDLFLLYQGIDPKAVVQVPMNADQLASALANQEVDAISVWEPWSHIALSLGGNAVRVLDAPRLYTQTFNLSVNNDYKQANLAKVGAMVEVLRDANAFIQRNPEEAQRIMARDTGLSLEFVKLAWNTHMFELSLQQSLLSTLQGQARWAVQENHIKAGRPEPEFLNYIDSSFLRRVAPNAVDFVFP